MPAPIAKLKWKNAAQWPMLMPLWNALSVASFASVWWPSVLALVGGQAPLMRQKQWQQPKQTTALAAHVVCLFAVPMWQKHKRHGCIIISLNNRLKSV
jgi:hypothetical protein